MTSNLDAAIAVASKLPPSEQDALAAILLAEITSEKWWSESFAKSQDVLEQLGDEALAEHVAGKTQPF